MSKSKEEQETIIRFDESSPTASLYTASPRIAKYWKKQGYALGVKSTTEGSPSGWTTEIPKKKVRVSKFASKRTSRRPTEALETLKIKRLQTPSTPQETQGQGDPEILNPIIPS